MEKEKKDTNPAAGRKMPEEQKDRDTRNVVQDQQDVNERGGQQDQESTDTGKALHDEQQVNALADKLAVSGEDIDDAREQVGDDPEKIGEQLRGKENSY